MADVRLVCILAHCQKNDVPPAEPGDGGAGALQTFSLHFEDISENFRHGPVKISGNF